MKADEMVRPKGAREWLIRGGGGHEDREDGIRAGMVSMEHAIELMDSYAAYRERAMIEECARIMEKHKVNAGPIEEVRALASRYEDKEGREG